MTSSALQLRRILQLVPRLADGGEHSIAEIAERAGVDRKTLLRDLQSLASRFDDPAGFVEGMQVFIDRDYVSVRSDHFLRPMRLTLAELRALELGLGMLHGESPPDERRAIAGAIARLRQVIAKLPTEPIEDDVRAAATGSSVDADHLASARRAIRQRHKIRLTYRKADAESAEERTTCPYAVVFASGMWYLVAHCEQSDGLRFFRLDRIERIAAIAERFEPPSLSVEALVRDGKAFRADDPGTLRVRYSPRIARWIAEREGVEVDADGSLTLEHPLADARWAVRHVLQYGPDAEVLEPAAVREEIVSRLKSVAFPR